MNRRPISHTHARRCLRLALALPLLALAAAAPARAQDDCAFDNAHVEDCITDGFDRRVAPALLTGSLSQTTSWDFQGLDEGFGFGFALAHADFNNDGLLDTVVSAYKGPAQFSTFPRYVLPGALYIFYAREGGGFEPYFTPLGGQFDYTHFGAAFVPEDIDGDGQMDLIVTALRPPHPFFSGVLTFRLDGDTSNFPPEGGPWYRGSTPNSTPPDPFFGFTECATTMRTPLNPNAFASYIGDSAVVARLGGNDRMLLFSAKLAADQATGLPNQGGLCACPFTIGEPFQDACIEVRQADIQVPAAIVALFGSSIDVWDRDGDGIDDVIVVGAENAVKPGTNLPTGAVFIADFALNAENDAIMFAQPNII